MKTEKRTCVLTCTKVSKDSAATLKQRGAQLARRERLSWGAFMEEQAARFYVETRGARILARNYHCSRGEIDLVVLEWEEWEEGEEGQRDLDSKSGDPSLVFVEVRARRSLGRGEFRASESLSARKLLRLQRAIRHYLVSNEKAVRQIGASRIRTELLAWERGAWQRLEICLGSTL
jgi:Holliday junction resolvase-like predicted endonuclease